MLNQQLYVTINNNIICGNMHPILPGVNFITCKICMTFIVDFLSICHIISCL